jgi:putative endonuclease
MLNNRELGNLGEDLAIQYLIKKEYIIINRNYRTRYGEIDIIAQNKDYLVFIEVKARKNTNFGYPREAVNFTKQRKIKNLANYYLLKENKTNSNIRFDVVEVFLDKNNEASSIELITNAFE